MLEQQKQININGLNVNYKQIGNGDVLIVLLHGWGVSSDKYSELARWLHSPERLWSQNVESDMQELKTKDNNSQKGSTQEYGADEDAKKLHSLEARTMEPADKFKIQNSSFKILIPDLPGFGKSDEPEENWRLDDYVEFADKFIEKASRKSGFEMVKNLLKKFDLKKIISAESQKASNQEIKINDKQSKYYDNMNYHSIDENQGKILKQVQDDNNYGARKIILIGHSFGGRIAIKYAAKYPEKIDKLILTGAAGIRHKLNARQKVVSILAKAGKKIFFILQEAKLPIRSLASFGHKILYKVAREKDYYKASPRMKEVMKNILAEDLTLILDKISSRGGSAKGGKTPTLLIWGANDNSTPLSDGKIMNEKIENSKLIIVDGANHSLPYQKPREFAEIAGEFIRKTEN